MQQRTRDTLNARVYSLLLSISFALLKWNYEIDIIYSRQSNNKQQPFEKNGNEFFFLVHFLSFFFLLHSSVSLKVELKLYFTS